MASIPFLVLESLSAVNWEPVLTNLYGGARLIKNLATNRHLLGWDESVHEEPDEGFASHVGEDIAEFVTDAKNQVYRLFET